MSPSDPSSAYVDAAHAGRLLVEMRESRRHIPELPDGLRPGTLAEAYDIQDALHDAGGWTIGALKVGATSEAAQAALAIAEPIAGRIPAGTVWASGSALALGGFHHPPLLECEFGLRLRRDVPAEHARPAPDDVWEFVDAIVPAIELVDSRFTKLLGASSLSLIADNSVAGAVVLGDAVPVTGPVDLATATVRLTIGGALVAEGVGAAVLGDPIRALAWVLDHEARRGRSVAAGTVVITGTCTGLVPSVPDTEIVADFGTFGSVALTFTT